MIEASPDPCPSGVVYGRDAPGGDRPACAVQNRIPQWASDGLSARLASPSDQVPGGGAMAGSAPGWLDTQEAQCDREFWWQAKS